MNNYHCPPAWLVNFAYGKLPPNQSPAHSQVAPSLYLLTCCICELCGIVSKAFLKCEWLMSTASPAFMFCSSPQKLFQISQTNFPFLWAGRQTEYLHFFASPPKFMQSAWTCTGSVTCLSNSHSSSCAYQERHGTPGRRHTPVQGWDFTNEKYSAKISLCIKEEVDGGGKALIFFLIVAKIRVVHVSQRVSVRPQMPPNSMEFI